MPRLYFTAEEAAAKLPRPPDRAALRALRRPEDVRELATGTRLWHLYKRGGDHPALWSAFRYYGPLDGRFDHHLPPRRVQKRGILYLATLIPTCIAEVFQAGKVIDRRRDGPWLSAHDTARPLVLLDLTSSWPTRAGASTLLNDGPRRISRVWSVAIYDAYPDVDGIYYASSMYRHEPCVALYERALDAMPDRPRFNRALSDDTLFAALASIADEIGYRLV